MIRQKIIFIIFMLCFFAGGALGETRWYLAASGTPTGLASGYPTFEANWLVTTEAKRVACSTLKAGTTMTTEVSPSTGTASYLFRQYVSDPLSADYTFPGNVRGQILGACPSASKAKPAIAIKVVSGDGTQVKAIVLPYTASGSTADQFPTTLQSRPVPIQTNLTTTTTALKGDRVVVEVGYFSGNPSAKSCSMRFGDNGSTDLTDTPPLGDYTDTDTTRNPWIEFGRDIPIQNSSMIIE